MLTALVVLIARADPIVMWLPHGSGSGGGGGSCAHSGAGYSDGCAGAPSVAAQYPALLDGYAVRPPWDVAGVDYGIGYSSTQTFKTPGVDTCPTNVTCNTSAHTFTINAANVTIDGWDLSPGGVAYQINCAGSCANPTITNNKWTADATGKSFFSGSGSNLTDAGGTISNNYINGNSQQPTVAGDIYSSGAHSGIWHIYYNWFLNAGEDAIQIGMNSGSLAHQVGLYIRYNLYDNDGNVGHPDQTQILGNSFYDTRIEFNTVRYTNSLLGSQGFYCEDNGITTTCQVTSISYNTAALQAPLTGHGINFLFIVDTSELVTTADVSNNYVDPTSINDAACDLTRHTIGPYNGTVTHTGNLNMKTGGALSSC